MANNYEKNLGKLQQQFKHLLDNDDDDFSSSTWTRDPEFEKQYLINPSLEEYRKLQKKLTENEKLLAETFTIVTEKEQEIQGKNQEIQGKNQEIQKLKEFLQEARQFINHTMDKNMKLLQQEVIELRNQNRKLQNTIETLSTKEEEKRKATTGTQRRNIMTRKIEQIIPNPSSYPDDKELAKKGIYKR